MNINVVRKWCAEIRRHDVNDWLETFRARAFSHMSGVDGFLGIRILVARDTDPCTATVLTTWKDMEAVRRYAGDQPAKAVIPEFMAPFLTDYDLEATFHDEVMVEVMT